MDHNQHQHNHHIPAPAHNASCLLLLPLLSPLQLWLLVLYIIIARATPALRVGIAAAVAGLSILCLPRRLWVSQLQRLGFICGLILLFTAIGSDSVPPLLQQHSLPGSMEGLNMRLAPDTPYSYVLLDLGGFVTVTRR